MIHHDFVIGNATAWHYWNSYEPGSASNPRYYLIAMNPRRASNSDTLFTITKNLWALGHYSLFIRPGMSRVETSQTDNMADTTIAKNIMISAFKDAAEKKLIVNMINYTSEDKNASLELESSNKNKKLRLTKHYITSAKEGDDIKPYPLNNKSAGNRVYNVLLPAKSITTFVFEK